MQLTIDKKQYDFKFGVGFVRKLDENYGIKQNGIAFGFGLARVVPGLNSYDPAVLAEVLQCAAKQAINLTKIDDYLDDCSDLEKVFETVLEEMSKANAVKLAVKKMKG